MTPRNRLLAVAAAVVMLLGVADAVPGRAAEAASITKLGWWTRNPASQAPADGFNVQRAPDGAVSLAAVEVVAGDRLQSATLILTESGGVRQGDAVLQVCATPNVWKAGPAQPWAEAPKPECERAGVDLTRNATSGTWAADVLSLLNDIDDGPVSLMVVPKASAVPVGFDIQFRAPQLDAEADPDAGSSGFSFDGGSSSSSGSFSGSGSSGGGSTSSFGGGSFGGGSFEPGPSSFTPAGDVATEAPPAPEGDVVADAGADESAAIPFPNSLAQAGSSGGGNRVLQMFFFVALSTIAAVGAGVGRRWMRERQPDAIA